MLTSDIVVIIVFMTPALIVLFIKLYDKWYYYDRPLDFQEIKVKDLSYANSDTYEKEIDFDRRLGIEPLLTKIGSQFFTK